MLNHRPDSNREKEEWKASASKFKSEKVLWSVSGSKHEKIMIKQDLYKIYARIVEQSSSL